MLGPTGSLVGPAGGAVVGLTGLNSAGYIDVAFTAPGGQTLDPSTITDAGAEFTILGATGFSIDTTKTPVFVGPAGSNTSIFRYWTTGTYTSGTVQITFIAGSYGGAGWTNTFTGPVAPENFIGRRRRDAEPPLHRRPADADERRRARDSRRSPTPPRSSR